jgi:16S rRNA G527 N7-methylase RsmG
MTILPAISADALAARLRALAPEPLPDAVVAALRAHYEELRRWAPRLALIGPGTADEVLERHFGESLAALPLVPVAPAEGGEALDLGSGAGFPGLVLAAARPRWRVTLVEARQRKWSFLVAAARRAALSCRCLDARVGVPLAEGLPRRIELLTARAVRLPEPVVAALLERLTPCGRALLWAGGADPALPPGFAVARSLPLPGSERRRLLEVVRRAPGGPEPSP